MAVQATTQAVLEAALTAGSLRGELLAQNVANADTPNYIRKDLKFDATLERLLTEQSGGQPIADAKAHLEEMRADHNNVDINHELAQVYDNALTTLATERLYSDSVQRLKTAISNG